MRNNKISTFKIAATYIGTVVGAGFASGQEILRFFTFFGTNGLIGLLISTLLFILFGYIIMDLGRFLNAKSHVEIIQFSSGKYLDYIIDAIITFFLFGSVTSMLAGAGAMVNHQFNISSLFGSMAMAAFAAITVLTGINGVINSISFVVPFLLTSVIGISIVSVFKFPVCIQNMSHQLYTNGFIQNWIWAAILYTSYNIVLSIAVLSPLGAEAKDRKAIKNGAIMGGLGLGIGSLAIYFAISSSINQITKIEIPMLYIAGRISYVVQISYAFILVAEIYTTAVGSLYGFVARLSDINSYKSKAYTILTVIAAFFASQLGFSNVVKYVYPIMGYSGIILLVCLLYRKITLHFQKK